MAEIHEDQVVIVKVKRKDPEEDGAHAGTWKIAYADFVTAMMAFFLLMWLVNATTEEQRDGISAFFNPVALATSVSGADGLMSGRTADTEGALTAPNGDGERPHPVSAPPTVSTIGPEQNAPQGQSGGTQVESIDGEFRSPFDRTAMADSVEGDKRYSGVADLLGSTAFQDPFERPEARLTADWRATPAEINQTQGTEVAKEKPGQTINVKLLKEAQGLERMELLKQALAAKLEKLLAEKDLHANVLMDVMAEGLRIQITDDSDFAMFPVGGDELTADADKLLSAVSSVLEQIPNGIIVTGHTDGRPYAPNASYGNWELASDRANAARRALVQGGLKADQIMRVEGYGDRELLVPDDPRDPRNRRISILVFAADQTTARAPAEQRPGNSDRL
jgi:chemotaxis protein MotB